VNHATDDHVVDSDVDDDDDDVTDARAVAAAGGGGDEEADAKLDEDSSGRDLLAHHHQNVHVDGRDAADSVQLQQPTVGDIRRRKRSLAADHVTSSPSVDGDDVDDDYAEFGLAGTSPSRRPTVGDSGPCSPGTAPPCMEQTEIKIQRPLGLLAQHGMTTKMSSATLQGRPAHSAGSLYKLDRQADLDQSSKDRQPLSVGHHQTPSLTGLDFSSTSLSLMDRRFMPSPPASSTPLGCLDHGKTSATSPGPHHWTFEEQFKQVSHQFRQYNCLTESTSTGRVHEVHPGAV